MSVSVPTLVGVIGRCVVIPGTASCFWRNSGTQNEWITSSARRLSSTCRPSSSRSSVVSKFPYCGYLKLHANWRAVTSTLSRFAFRCPFSASAIALRTAMIVTSTAGIAVHVISSPVCPWIGGPSESSSGRARKVTTE